MTKIDDPFHDSLRYNPLMPSLRALLLILILPSFAVLAGCGDGSADASFTTYIERLENTLDEAANENTLPAPLPRLPRAGQLRLPIGSDSLGPLDFLALRGCDLQVTVGKQNSSLGKLARDSQRLLLALEFLEFAPACITELIEEGEAELAQDLTRALELKRQQLPALVFNATLGSSEFADLWRPVPLDASYPDNTSSAVITALEQVSAASTRWLSGELEADNLAFELQLSEISLGDGGQLWRALAHQAHWLDKANSVLQRRAAKGPLCSERIRPAAADILPNVVRKFFIDGIQPRAAVLGRRYHELLPPITALEQQLDAVLPDAYRAWQRQRNAALASLSQAPRAHVRALQTVLNTCEQSS